MNLPSVDSTAFRHHHDRYLAPMREGLQARRDRAWRQIVTRAVVSPFLLAAIIGTVLVVRRPEDEFFWWLFAFIVFLFVILLFIWCAVPWGVHKMRLKSDVLTRLVPFFGDFAYRPEPEGILGPSVPGVLLPPFNRDFKEDEVVGSHAGVPLRALEVSLSYEYTTGTSKNRRTVTDRLFKGVLLELVLATPVRGTVLFGSPELFEGRCAVPADAGLEPVPLDRKEFMAWSSDPAEAASLLDPEFLARAAALQSRGGVKHMRMAWQGDRLGMLVDFGADFFELPQRGAIDFHRDAGIVGEQLGRVTAVIDLLGLDPVPGVDSDAPRHVEDRIRWAKPLEASAEEEDRACLPLVLLSIASFCTYVVILSSVIRPIGVLLLALSFGMLAGLGLSMLLFSKSRVRGLVLLAIGLLGLAPALPDHVLDDVPLGKYVKEMRFDSAD
ncbi:MAG TPA: hypothetical protein PKZ76_02175 [Xanthomonadaceae bacterium]|nr:hypothetical protein [Xanthomonadaceae bacterium]